MDDTAIAYLLTEGATLEEAAAWLDAHPLRCSYALVVLLKQLVDASLNHDTTLARHSASVARLVAERVPNEERLPAMLEAEWSLGNVTMSTGQATRGLNHYLRRERLRR
ncbi:MAG: hypothetical protein HC884_09150 [Chloroflexaceae bacterium]|nr:hypothetical protein [Chloroflexaceae bacterium]